MKFKTVLPYLLVGSLVTIPKTTADFHDLHKTLPVKPQKEESIIELSQTDKLHHKAKELCDSYIDLVLQGQQHIKHRKGGYTKAVKTELPGAPVGLHCIYGQYTQLNRALDALGDTLRLIPYEARNACSTFKTKMQNKYKDGKYAGALHNGKMFKSDAEYFRAFQAFLKHNRVTPNTPDDVKQKIIARFEKNNFSVESLHPGTILIIQKTENPNNTHAVMFLGRGRVENGTFIEDSTGRFMYAGYNNESIDDIFKTFNTNHIFAADIYDIAFIAYKDELQKIKNMEYDDLFRFVYEIPNDMYAMAPNRSYLQDMAEDKYFDKQNFTPTYPVATKNMASIPLFPAHNLIMNKLSLKR